MAESMRTVFFAIILAVSCSVLLTAASKSTEPRRVANEKAEEVRTILAALDVPLQGDMEAAALLDIYKQNVRSGTLGSLKMFEYVPQGTPGGKPESVAFPVEGPGIWGHIKGIISLRADLVTIRRLRFYKQEETPGLGGEIGSDWFLNKFEGKTLVADNGKPGFRLVKPGVVSDINSVDGITGATLTSNRVAELLDGIAVKIWEERQKYGK